MRKSLLLASLLIALVLIGGALRFHHLGHKGLWSDELFSTSVTLYHSIWPPATGEWFRRTDLLHIADTDSFWTAKAADQSPPLFELTTKVSTKLLGPTEFAMRLPSALAALLLLTWFAWQAWARRREGDSPVYCWALLLAVGPASLIEYAQEARAYSLAGLFAAVMATKFYQRVRDGFRTERAPGYAELGVFVLACHTHVTLIVLSAMLLSVYAWAGIQRKDWRELARLALVPLACLPWLYLSAHTFLFTAGGAMGWADKAQLSAFSLGFNPASAFGLAVVSLGDLLGNALIALLIVALMAQVTTSLLNGRSAREPHISPAGWSMVVCALLFLFVVAWLLSRSGTFNKRHFLAALPFALLAVADVLSLHLHRKWQIAMAGAALLVLPLQDTLATYRVPKESYREAANWVMDHVPDTAPILTSWEPNRHYYRFYLEATGGQAAWQRTSSVSRPDEENSVCERVRNSDVVGVFAHAYHATLISTILQHCPRPYHMADSYVGVYVFAQRWERAQ